MTLVDYACPIPTNSELGQDYLERYIPVVDQRLALAGVRLAAMLNEIFDGDRSMTGVD